MSGRFVSSPLATASNTAFQSCRLANRQRLPAANNKLAAIIC